MSASYRSNGRAFGSRPAIITHFSIGYGRSLPLVRWIRIRTLPLQDVLVPTNFGKHGASLTTKFGNRFVYQRTKRTKRSSCVDRNFFFPGVFWRSANTSILPCGKQIRQVSVLPSELISQVRQLTTSCTLMPYSVLNNKDTHRSGICTKTAQRWLTKLGWIYGRNKKGYCDGHEKM